MGRRTAARRESNVREETVSRAYKPGDKVYGIRSPNAVLGEYVSMYVTINDGYRNPAYRVRCDKDGKIRVFQGLRKVARGVPTQYTIS